jgi:hypothetical protein
VAELLEQGHPIEEVALTDPPGERAYVLNADLGPQQPKLYVKIQVKGGCVFGRSFHYSYR